MDNTSFSLRRQWCQLLSLTLAHAVADVYVGIVAPVLVPLRDHYGVSIALLIFITSLLAFSANAWQIPIGNMRAFWSSPLPIAVGVFLSGLSVFLGVLPKGPVCPIWMSAVAIVTGFGVAIVHPEGLRAVHGLTKISSSLSTAVFMVAGFAGFSGGALISSSMTEAWGLSSLVWLYALAPLAVVPLFITRVRLPVVIGTKKSESDLRENIPSIPFLPIFIMGATLATCSQVQATLLPTYLHKDVGYALSFSGFSFTLFGVGGMVGAITWGALAPRIGHLRLVLFSSLFGAPLTLLYLLWAPHSKMAALLLTFTGFVVYTGFPLCITLARYADSPLRFGQRMGLISGGTWGIAAIVLWILGPLSEYTGMGPLLHLVWIGYLATAIMVVWLKRRLPNL